MAWGLCGCVGTEPCAVSPAEGEVSAEEEGFENLNTMASTFIVLFLLSLFYSTTVTLFKVDWRAVGGQSAWHRPGASTPTSVPSQEEWLMLSLLPAGEVTHRDERGDQRDGTKRGACRLEPGAPACMAGPLVLKPPRAALQLPL